MKLSCKVIEDILPLYADECCSEDTKMLVEEHLVECDTCKEKLEKLRQPVFLSQEHCISEKEYAKHSKKAFHKLRRRWIALTLAVVILLTPFIWLGFNEVKGEGVSYSNLAYVIRGYTLLRTLKNGNYEKAFDYLDLKHDYDINTKFDETHIDLGYHRVNVGGDIFYVDQEMYKNEYQRYLKDKDEAVFWRAICLKEHYMIPVSKADLYLKDLDEREKHNFMEYKVSGIDYYIDGDDCDYEIEKVENCNFAIMPEEFYNRINKQYKEERNKSRKIIQGLRDMGYDGYVDVCKKAWIDNFEVLKENGITLVGYKLSRVYKWEEEYEIGYKVKFNVHGKTNYDFVVIFRAKENGFDTAGSIGSGEYNGIPIGDAFSITTIEKYQLRYIMKNRPKINR